MGAMRALVVVEVLPLRETGFEIHIALVVQELVELLLIRAVGALDLPIELRGPRLDVDVPDALIGQVPVEEGLELMPAVGADRVDAEGEALDEVVGEPDRVRLRVPRVDVERPDPGRIAWAGTELLPERRVGLQERATVQTVLARWWPRFVLASTGVFRARQPP